MNSTSSIPWRVVGASVRGKSHQYSGLPCQDAHFWGISHGHLFIAAADGAGSAALSEYGASIATQAAVAHLKNNIEPVLSSDLSEYSTKMWDSFSAARTAVTEYSVQKDVSLRDLASTLILAIATTEGVVVGQIGDGAAVVADSNSTVIALTRPQSGEFINETTFLTAADALSQIQIGIWRGAPKYIGLFTDGLQMLALRFPSGEPHAKFFLPLFRFIDQPIEESVLKENLSSFLSSARIRERTDDDVTLLLCARSESDAGTPR